MQPDEDQALNQIRRRRFAWAATLLLLPLAYLGFRELPWPESGRQLVLLAWCGLYCATTLLCVFARCPRCAGLFHSVYPTHNPLTRSCRGCGLSL